MPRIVDTVKIHSIRIIMSGAKLKWTFLGWYSKTIKSQPQCIEIWKIEKQGKSKSSRHVKTFCGSKSQYQRRTGEPSYEGVFRQILSSDFLVEDVRGVGLVKEINETDVLLECAEGILLQLPANRISRTFTKQMSTSDVTLDDIFTIGQAIAFKVFDMARIQDDRNKTKSKPKVSTCPYEVNGHLLPSNFTPGTVVNGIISSIEEKGAVVDIGIAGEVKGFVQKEDLPAYLTLHIGQVVLFRVKPNCSEASRVISLSAFPEMDTLDDPKFQMNHLMPGTILTVEPEKIVADGVYVNLKNGTKAFVRKIHLPPRIRFDMDRCIKAFRVCVICCQQNSPLLVLSAHPDVIALAKVEKRVVPEELKIGQKINCKVYDLDKKQNVYFRLEDDESGKSCLITAKALRIHIDDVDKNISKYALDSSHVCRVIGYNSLERLLLVSCKSYILSQKIVSVMEAKPAEKFMCTVVAIKPNGLTVNLCGDVFGYVTTMHVKNKPSSVWQKGFRKDQKVACRVLYLDNSTKRLIMTAKPALVETTDKLVTAYDEGMMGDVAVGTVVKILESGGLLVGFFNHVVGLLHSSDAKKVVNLQLGMPIKVRIKSVDATKKLMYLDFGEECISSSASSTVPKVTRVKSSVKRPAKPFRIYSAKVLGPWPYGGSSPDTTAELLLDGGSIGRLHASEINISKYVEGSFPMKEFLTKNQDKLVTVKVICVGKPKNLSDKGKEKLMDDHNTPRIVECTLDEAKIAETHKKLRLINYQSEFDYGARVAAYVVSPEHSTLNTLSGTTILGEVNPQFKVMISAERTNKVAHPASKDANTEMEICGELFSGGELVFGKVVGVNKTKRCKYVELTLLDEDKKSKKKRTKAVSEVKEELDDTKDDVFVLPSPAFAPKNMTCTQRKRRFVKVQEATFEWSLAGFTMDDLAEVGRKTDSNEKAGVNQAGVKKPRKDDDIHLLKLSEEERKLLGDGAECELDFDKDYSKAKSIAERSLKVINFKEDEELFNIWKST
uniref:S1 motif domain-containing protein n=1 Tax=Ditylenchus dipsaci TaxID=166011 RepID=A0A915ER45_9BILA